MIVCEPKKGEKPRKTINAWIKTARDARDWVTGIIRGIPIVVGPNSDPAIVCRQVRNAVEII